MGQAFKRKTDVIKIRGERIPLQRCMRERDPVNVVGGDPPYDSHADYGTEREALLDKPAHDLVPVPFY
jgi:hypothetical protein